MITCVFLHHDLFFFFFFLRHACFVWPSQCGRRSETRQQKVQSAPRSRSSAGAKQRHRINYQAPFPRLTHSISPPPHTIYQHVRDKWCNRPRRLDTTLTPNNNTYLCQYFNRGTKSIDTSLIHLFEVISDIFTAIWIIERPWPMKS